jgi:hypothetical protein
MTENEREYEEGLMIAGQRKQTIECEWEWSDGGVYHGEGDRKRVSVT